MAKELTVECFYQKDGEKIEAVIEKALDIFLKHKMEQMIEPHQNNE